MSYGLCTGQAKAGPYGYSPLPLNLVQAGMTQLAKLKAAAVDADYFEIDSDFGHSASGLDAAKWAPRLKTFMAGLEKRS